MAPESSTPVSGGPRLSLDWWAFVVALVLAATVRSGLLGSVPW
jgi:hypothetical protein